MFGRYAASLVGSTARLWPACARPLSPGMFLANRSKVRAARSASLSRSEVAACSPGRALEGVCGFGLDVHIVSYAKPDLELIEFVDSL